MASLSLREVNRNVGRGQIALAVVGELTTVVRGYATAASGE
jgi:hypothetical protein